MATLDEVALDYLADVLAPRIEERLRGRAAVTEDTWLGAEEAAQYLGLSKQAVYKVVRAGNVRHEQEGKGCKVWFKRSWLDDYRTGATDATCGASNVFTLPKALPKRGKKAA